MKRNALFFLVVIALVAVLAGVFVYPRWLGARFLSWRLGLDLVGGSHLVYTVDLSRVDSGDHETVLNGLRDVIGRRVNLFGVAEPQVFVSRAGDEDRLVVELAGLRDVSAAIREIGATPFLLFAEVQIPESENGAATTSALAEPQFISTELTGRYVKGAQLVFHNVTGTPQISLEFDGEGARLFEEITERNVGKPIAVLLDNEVITAPIVQEKITGGQAQITGDFTLEEARELVERFNAGALPAPITLVAQQTVGASLGADSLTKTLKAGVIGTALVMLFMIAYYRGLGFFAALALVMYIIFTLFVFKIFAITMTLAGIAGIILSIGMAVGANILIFERSREEIKRGLPRQAALEEGFRRAWFSIRDSNVTTTITAVILFLFTSGFVKGFALALLIGVLVSMFSAITVTRTMLRAFTRPSP